MTALLLIVLCGALSIVYAIWATGSVLKADAGNPRMQEIAAAVREGAQAYLKRQYMTIGMVGIVMNQSFPTVAPLGGAGALFGNQPFAFGVPTARHDPVLYDASMTQSSASGMFLAAKQKQKIAPGLLLDEHGRCLVTRPEIVRLLFNGPAWRFVGTRHALSVALFLFSVFLCVSSVKSFCINP